MADIELVEGEASDVYDITIKDKDGNTIDLTAKGFTAISMEIALPDSLATPTKSIPTSSFAITGASNEIASWTVLSTEIPSAGNYLAMLTFTGGGLIRKTRRYLSVHVKEKIG